MSGPATTWCACMHVLALRHCCATTCAGVSCVVSCSLSPTFLSFSPSLFPSAGEWELIPGFGLLFVWENIDSCRTVLDAAATATMFREAHASVQAGDKLAATRLLSVLRGLPQLDRMDAAVSGDSPPSADEEEGFVARSLRLAEAVVSSEDDPSIMSLFLSLLTRHSPGHEEEYHGIVPVPVAGRWDGDGYSPEWVRTTFPQSGRDVDTKLARSRCE